MSDKNQALSEIFKSLGNPEGGPVSMEHAREAILIEREDLPEVALRRRVSGITRSIRSWSTKRALTFSSRLTQCIPSPCLPRRPKTR